jgi:hypothetical protein
MYSFYDYLKKTIFCTFCFILVLNQKKTVSIAQRIFYSRTYFNYSHYLRDHTQRYPTDTRYVLVMKRVLVFPDRWKMFFASFPKELRN